MYVCVYIYTVYIYIHIYLYTIIYIHMHINIHIHIHIPIHIHIDIEIEIHVLYIYKRFGMIKFGVFSLWIQLQLFLTTCSQAARAYFSDMVKVAVLGYALLGRNPIFSGSTKSTKKKKKLGG